MKPTSARRVAAGIPRLSPPIFTTPRSLAASQSRLLRATTSGQSRALTSITEKAVWLIPRARNPTLLMPTAGNPRRFAAQLGRVDYFALNKGIMQCNSAKQIEDIVTNNPKMDHVNIATAYRAMMMYLKACQLQSLSPRESLVMFVMQLQTVGNLPKFLRCLYKSWKRLIRQIFPHSPSSM